MENRLIIKKSTNIFSFDESKTKVSGYGASFGGKDAAGDVFVKGCFANAIRDFETGVKKVAFCWQHELDNPIGKILSLSEDNTGLLFEAELDAVEDGRRAQTQYKSGTLDQHSVSMSYDWSPSGMRYDPDTDTTYIMNVRRLYEISPVTIGANENTPFLGFKSLDGLMGLIQKDVLSFAKKLNEENEHGFLQLAQKMMDAFSTEGLKQELKAEALKEMENEYAMKSFLHNLKSELKIK